MNNAVSARPEGTACVTPVTVSGPKHLANLWLLAATQVIDTLAAADDREAIELYVDIAGGLFAQPVPTLPPPDAVYVCKVGPSTPVEVVAARLRHASSRWRIEPTAVPGGDND